MKSSTNPYNDEYLEFCGGNKIDFSLMSDKLYNQFTINLSVNSKFSEIVDFFKDDLDQLAYCAVHAFSQGKLTRTQTAIFLEYRSLRHDFPKVEIIDQIQEGEYLNHFIPERDQNRLKHILSSIPAFEHCVFDVSIYQPIDPMLSSFLHLLNNLSLIKLENINLPQREMTSEIGDTQSENSKKYARMILGGAGMRDAITKSIFLDHAKGLFHKLGIIGINDIQSSVIKHCRYASVDFPGIKTSDSFHALQASTTFLTLHDEVHRRLISSVYNPIFDAMLHAVQVTRNMVEQDLNITDSSKEIWSREIWDCVDMEVGTFIKEYANNNDSNPYDGYQTHNSEQLTADFIELMNAKILTRGKYIGLFTTSPFIDTTWALVLDIVLHSGEWQKKGVDLSLLDNNNHILGKMYRFTNDNREKLIYTDSFANQIAILKSLWFGLTYTQSDAKFIKNDRYPRYIEVHADGKSIVMSKEKYFECKEHFDNGLSAIKDVDYLKVILYEPNVFMKVIKNVNDLNALITNFPEHKTMINDVLSKDIFSHHKAQSRFPLNATFDDSLKLIKQYPDYAIDVIKDAFSPNIIYDLSQISKEYLVDTIEKVNRLINSSPRDKELIYQLIIKEPELLNKLFKSKGAHSNSLRDELCSIFSDHKDDLQELFNNQLIHASTTTLTRRSLFAHNQSTFKSDTDKVVDPSKEHANISHSHKK